ncbi:S-layer homology domain-containing protein [Lederbergia panacisoli]|uniref:S-layer homology domain-containing protein n=1 Tax=Lederbergia panacisoli TaxID=1255251 RepID=UPI00214C8E72|nr:S-layer homology domain-containing protein [Lederbergia panacisoli]MCR2823601.1 S-layer homology domain-containing protein [Lederbergia panacisoli]
MAKQFVKFTYKLINATNRILSEEKSLEPMFVDAIDIDERAKNAVAFAQKLGISDGYGDQMFKPNQEITWLEALIMSVRAMQWTLEDLSENQQLYSSVQRPHTHMLCSNEPSFDTLTEEEFVNVMNNPVLLGDGMLMMIEMMKGEEAYEQVDS